MRGPLRPRTPAEWDRLVSRALELRAVILWLLQHGRGPQVTPMVRAFDRRLAILTDGLALLEAQHLGPLEPLPEPPTCGCGLLTKQLRASLSGSGAKPAVQKV